MPQTLLTVVGVLGALLGGLAALGTLLSSLTRRARLRRDEAMWRQALDPTRVAASSTTDQHRLVEDLHRYTLARLVAMDFVPNRTFWTAGVFAAAGSFLLGTSGWLLSQSVADRPETPLVQHVAEMDGVTVLVIPALLVAFGTGWFLGAVAARHAVAGAVLQGRYPAPVWPGPVLSWDVALLTLGLATGSLAAGALGGLLSWSTQQSSSNALETVSPWLVVGSMLVLSAALGVVSVRLVTPDGPLRRDAPSLTSLASLSHPEQNPDAQAGRVIPDDARKSQEGSSPPQKLPGWGAALLAAAIVAARARRRR